MSSTGLRVGGDPAGLLVQCSDRWSEMILFHSFSTGDYPFQLPQQSEVALSRRKPPPFGSLSALQWRSLPHSLPDTSAPSSHPPCNVGRQSVPFKFSPFRIQCALISPSFFTCPGSQSKQDAPSPLLSLAHSLVPPCVRKLSIPHTQELRPVRRCPCWCVALLLPQHYSPYSQDPTFRDNVHAFPFNNFFP